MTLDKFTQQRHDYQEFTKQTFAYSGNLDLDIYHCLVGVLSESIELGNETTKLQGLTEDFNATMEQIAAQRVRVRKEYGDICYYLAMLGNLLNIKFDYAVNSGRLNLELGDALEALADTIKRGISYKLVIQAEHLIVDYKHTVSCLNIMMMNRNISLYDILQENRAKLEARYPDKVFKKEDAANKADEKNS